MSTLSSAKKRVDFDPGAKKVALKIANSNLLKTAVFGNDTNWGRIVMAEGNAGVRLKLDRLDLLIGKVQDLKGCAIAVLLEMEDGKKRLPIC